MDDEETTVVVDKLISLLGEFEASRSNWAYDLDPLSRRLSREVDRIVLGKETDLASIAKLLARPGNSFQACADNVTVAACWLFLNGSTETQDRLRTTLEKWGGVVTLLESLAGRLFLRFKSVGNIQHARFALAALALLGNSADMREETRFVEKIRAVIVERGFNAGEIFAQFAPLCTGPMQTLMGRIAVTGGMSSP